MQRAAQQADPMIDHVHAEAVGSAGRGGGRVAVVRHHERQAVEVHLQLDRHVAAPRVPRGIDDRLVDDAVQVLGGEFGYEYLRGLRMAEHLDAPARSCILREPFECHTQGSSRHFDRREPAGEVSRERDRASNQARHLVE